MVVWTGQDEATPMRIEVTKKVRKEKSGLPLLAALLALIGGAYLLGAPEVAAHFPQSVERALTNMRGEIDKAGEAAMYSVSGVFGNVSSFVAR
jgi:hypothetical protein